MLSSDQAISVRGHEGHGEKEFQKTNHKIRSFSGSVLSASYVFTPSLRAPSLSFPNLEIKCEFVLLQQHAPVDEKKQPEQSHAEDQE